MVYRLIRQKSASESLYNYTFLHSVVCRLSVVCLILFTFFKPFHKLRCYLVVTHCCRWGLWLL